MYVLHIVLYMHRLYVVLFLSLLCYLLHFQVSHFLYSYTLILVQILKLYNTRCYVSLRLCADDYIYVLRSSCYISFDVLLFFFACWYLRLLSLSVSSRCSRICMSAIQTATTDQHYIRKIHIIMSHSTIIVLCRSCVVYVYFYVSWA